MTYSASVVLDDGSIINVDVWSEKLLNELKTVGVSNYQNGYYTFYPVHRISAIIIVDNVSVYQRGLQEV